MSTPGDRASGAFAAIGAQLAAALHVSVSSQPARPVHGGCINESYRWESRAGALFVKAAPAERLAMFTAEAEGLQELARAKAVPISGAATSASTLRERP